MGTGKAGAEPLKYLLKRYPNVEKRYATWNALDSYRKENLYQSGVYFIDIFLMIDCFMRSPGLHSSIALFNYILNRVIPIARIPTIHAIVLCLDTKKGQNVAKNYCRNKKGGRNSKSSRGIHYKTLQIVLDDRAPPMDKDQWDTFRRHELLSLQINLYLAEKFSRLKTLPIKDTWIIVDNAIRREELYDSGSPVEKPIHTVVHSALLLHYDQSGRCDQSQYQNKWCSGIAEGELAMIYWIHAIRDCIPIFVDVFFLDSIDQDILSNVLLRKPCRDERIVVIMRKKRPSKAILAKIAEAEVQIKQCKSKKPASLTRKVNQYRKNPVGNVPEYCATYDNLVYQIEQLQKAIKEWRQKKQKVTFMYDMKLLLQQIHDRYQQYHLNESVYIEPLLLNMGECDIHDKPFAGIGWILHAEELLQNIEIHKEMLQLIRVHMVRPDGTTLGWGRTLLLDRKGYERYAVAVHKRKGKALPVSQKEITRRDEMVKQIAHNFWVIRYVPYIRWKTGQSHMSVPTGWGYRKVKVPGSVQKVWKNAYETKI